MIFNSENILLIGSILLFVSLVVGNTGYRLGVPALLLFLCIGMFAGSDGVGIQFHDPKEAQFIGVISLSIILFSGGMDTKLSEVKPILAQGILLSTIGVLLTTLLTGLFISWIAGFVFPGIAAPLIGCLLLAAIMSSTDSASVFNVLRSHKLHLKENLRPMLELESGSNDPMAYMLTILLIQIIQSGELSWSGILLLLATQFSVGALAGYLLGRLAVYTLNRIQLQNSALYQVILLTFVFFTFSFTGLLSGNGYLAVYIAGLVIGNRRIVYKKNISNFFDGLAWLFQIIMFLALGLLVNPLELIDVACVGLLIGVFMMFVARPVSVFLCLLPFRKMTLNSRIFVSWIGLRGAVPIIFATYPLIAGIPGAHQIFNVVFFITLLSLLLQGTTVVFSANLLRLVDKTKKESKEFGMELPDEIKSTVSEIIVTTDTLICGDRLIDLPLPDNTLVVLIKRYNHFFVPNGNTLLIRDDKLLIISDNEDELRRIYSVLGVEEYTIYKN